MNIARLWRGIAAVLGVLSLVLLGVVARPGATIRAEDTGGTCAGWSGGRGRTMTAAITVHNDAGSDAHVLGISARRQQGDGTVGYRMIAGTVTHTGFGTATALADGHPIAPVRGTVVPAHGSATVLVTVTVGPRSQLVALGHLDVSVRGPLGTMRSTVLGTALGFMAPGQRLCDLAAVS